LGRVFHIEKRPLAVFSYLTDPIAIEFELAGRRNTRNRKGKGLRYFLAALLLAYLPFLGILIGGSTSSLVLNFLGRENRDARSLRLSRELIETVAGNNPLLFLAGLLPFPLVAYLWQRILSVQSPLPWLFWILPFGRFYRAARSSPLPFRQPAPTDPSGPSAPDRRCRPSCDPLRFLPCCSS
jgi:hypothetical protein